MFEQYEQKVVLEYVHNLIQDIRTGAKALVEICEFLDNNLTALGLDVENEVFCEALSELQEGLEEKIVPRAMIREGKAMLCSHLSCVLEHLQQPEASPLQQNLEFLSTELGLSAQESQLFSFITRYYTYEQLQRLCDEITNKGISSQQLCSMLLHQDQNDLSQLLRPTSKLLTTGVVRPCFRSGSDLDDSFEIPDAVRTALQKVCSGAEDIRTYILGEPLRASLLWDDFEHMGDTHERLAEFLRAALQEQIAGVNVLLWGAPGTGKTELCKTLAQHLGVHIYATGEEDDEGGEPTRRERIGDLQLAQNLLRYQNRSLLMFDEMDDLFEGNALTRMLGGRASMGSKVFTNRLFENNPVPTLWIINDADMLDPAIVRRMSLAIEMRVPPAQVRERVWQRVLDKNSMTLPQEEVKHLAKLDIAPAVVDSAARVARQIGGRKEDFEFATKGLVRVLSGPKALKRESAETAFHLELMHCDIDLEGLMQQAAATQRRDFSLCLYGPPGTGKSAFVRHLAKELEMPVVFKRASDLLNAYVGSTEKNIAAAFEEALEQEAFLVFDEADSMLGDRRNARHNWEVSQVNEMLTWMESHPLPFACTTNLMDRVDEASLRRFTFKCECKSLSSEQLSLAFAHFFGCNLPVDKVPHLRGLTPGDFALAHKKAEILAQGQDTHALVDLLKQELDAKKGKQSRPIGFGQV